MNLTLERISVFPKGKLEYTASLEAMREFTRRRDETTPDEIWLLEHPPVYTLGQGADDATVANGIPVVRSDRGGEITYHGPGQVVLYALIDLARPFTLLPPALGVVLALKVALTTVATPRTHTPPPWSGAVLPLKREL